MHLPKYDTTIILVDKRGAEYKTKFLVGKTGLSGGWRGFSIAHNLLEGDVLVFGLVQPTKFMVTMFGPLFLYCFSFFSFSSFLEKQKEKETWN